jgi:hypothetical protein
MNEFLPCSVNLIVLDSRVEILLVQYGYFPFVNRDLIIASLLLLIYLNGERN